MISNKTDTNHVPAVVIVWWQQAKPDFLYSWHRPCSSSCFSLMTTGKERFFYNTDTDHVPAVVIVWWQQAKDDFLWNWHRPCSSSCYSLMTTGEAWFFIILTQTMFQLLLYSDNNRRSMISYNTDTAHVPAVVMVCWQQKKHDFLWYWQRPCSSCCYSLMTTGEAWCPMILTITILQLLL